MHSSSYTGCGTNREVRSHCSSKGVWRAGDAACQDIFQAFSGGTQCRGLIYIGEALVRTL
jgi:hypothetical protein